MAKDGTRIEIGFTGGGSTVVQAADNEVATLRSAVLEAGADAGWHTLKNSDGSEFLVHIGAVNYLRVAPESRGIGFGG